MTLSDPKRSAHRFQVNRLQKTLFSALVVAALPALLGLTFTLNSSTLTYTARDSRNEWQGVAPLSEVTLTETEDELQVEAVLEPGRFDSGNFARDGNARFTVFEVEEFPTATLGGSLPPTVLEGGVEAVTFSGTLTLHGVTRDVTFPVQVTRDGAQATAAGSFDVLLSDYEMTRPNLFGIVVEDRVELTVSLTGTLEP